MKKNYIELPVSIGHVRSMKISKEASLFIAAISSAIYIGWREKNVRSVRSRERIRKKDCYEKL